MEIQKFKKKPVVIKAARYDGTPFNAEEIVEWIGADARYLPKEHSLEIVTLEGVMTVAEGDYVIKGIEDEFYPCKPGIFRDSYEEVNDG